MQSGSIIERHFFNGVISIEQPKTNGVIHGIEKAWWSDAFQRYERPMNHGRLSGIVQDWGYMSGRSLIRKCKNHLHMGPFIEFNYK